MSMDDDIFDVIHALEGRPEADSFDRMIERYDDLVEYSTRLKRENDILKETIKIVQKDESSILHK